MLLNFLKIGLICSMLSSCATSVQKVNILRVPKKVDIGCEKHCAREHGSKFYMLYNRDKDSYFCECIDNHGWAVISKSGTIYK